jgi:acetyl esterase/lipase
MICLVLLCWSAVYSQEEIPLYDVIPNSIPTETQENIIYDSDGNIRRISNVIYPRLIAFFPQKPSEMAIIICPGGGYQRLNIENTRFIAQRLNKKGITVFSLIYRLPSSELQVNPSISGLQDVQEALRLVRRRAPEWGLSNDKIGLWGSSAGGHLAAMAATHTQTVYEEAKTTEGIRPDFLILAWPVVSFKPPLEHKGSVRNLLGENPEKEQLTYFSPEEWVDRNTPPVFLVHAGDDPSIKVNNSIVFYQALRKAGVSAEMHLYETGGHGFGISPEVKESWMEQLFLWIQNCIK